MSKYRIAFVVNNLNVGGLEKVVISLIRSINPELFDIYLICLDGEGILFADTGLARDKCLVLDKIQTQLGPFSFNFRNIVSINKFVRQNKIQIVHAHNLAPLIYGGIASSLCFRRPKIIYTEHNQINSASNKTKSRFSYYLKLADMIVTVSINLKQILESKYYKNKPIKVLYNGIDGNLFSNTNTVDMRTKYLVAPGNILIGTAVVLSEQKGITYLIQAASLILKYYRNVQFVVAGDGPLRALLENELETLGIGANFKFVGYVKQVPDFIAALDLYVLPSLWEGLPLALLEALALGKPIVCTDVGGNPEIVEDGINGYLVPPKDAEALASKILMIVNDDSFSNLIVQRNRDKFERNFSEQAMVAAHEDMYMHLICGK